MADSIIKLPSVVVDLIVRRLDWLSRHRVAEAIPEWSDNVERFNQMRIRHYWMEMSYPDSTKTDLAINILKRPYPIRGIVEHWCFGDTTYVVFSGGIVFSTDGTSHHVARFPTLTCPSMRCVKHEFVRNISSVNESGLMIEGHIKSCLDGSPILSDIMLSGTCKIVSLRLGKEWEFRCCYHIQRLSGRKHQFLVYEHTKKIVRYFETIVRAGNDEVLVQQKWSKPFVSTFHGIGFQDSERTLSLNDTIAAIPSFVGGKIKVSILSLVNGDTIKELDLPKNSPVALSLKDSNILVAIQSSTPYIHKSKENNKVIGNINLFDLETSQMIASKDSTLMFQFHNEDHLHKNKLIVCANRDVRPDEAMKDSFFLEDGSFLNDINILGMNIDPAFRAVTAKKSFHSFTWITDDILIIKDDPGVHSSWERYNVLQANKKRKDEGHTIKSIRGRTPEKVDTKGFTAVSRNHFVNLSKSNKLKLNTLS